MRAIPTDLQILDAIYERYYETFITFSKEDRDRVAKTFVPIDIRTIAHDLGVDPDIVFGRLYYHLEQKYGYERGDAYVHFFALRLKDDTHSINFPYMASVLAQLREENRKYRLATGIAFVSLLLSVVALLLSVFL